MSDEEVSTDPGQELLFENDRLRVGTMTLGPGESCHVHRHLFDHLFVYADPGAAEAFHEGSDYAFSATHSAGFVYYKEVGRDGLGPHWIKNTGSSPATQFIVELLGESASEAEAEAQTNGRWSQGEARSLTE
jgi:hypothetical protein